MNTNVVIERIPVRRSGVVQEQSARRQKTNIVIGRLVLAVVLLLAWEFASGTLINDFFTSKPSAIAAKLYKYAADGSLFRNMGITAFEAISGFMIGGTLGASVGILLGRARKLSDLLHPFITGFYSIPKIALAPLFIMWFGIGFPMRIYFTSLIVFFLVFLSTYTGVRNVSRELLTVFRLMGAQERDLIRVVILPSVVTWVFTGLRLSVPYSMIGAIVAEMMAANMGLGYMVEHAASQFDTAGVFASLIGIIFLALVLGQLTDRVERAVMPWKSTEPARTMAV
jgi:NitT/TauT family transport system permease protein